MKKKHIFFLFFHLGLGGIQRKIVDMVNYINENEAYNDVVVHIVVKRKESFSFESQLPKNFKFLHVQSDFHNRKGKVGYIIFLSYLVLRYRPIILVPFLHQITMYAVFVKYLFFWRKIKVIACQDNILSFENKFPYATIIYSNNLIKFCYKAVDKIITQTNFAKNDLVKNFLVFDKKIIIIKNWLKDTKIIRSKKKYDLIYCGRFSIQKKIIRILKITLLLKKKLPDIQVCFIGDGSEKEKIENFISENNLNKNVTIRPPKRFVIGEIAKSKIFILTSEYEGHPMVLLEAMAQKIVPVVLKYPGVHEYLDHEKNGFIENSYDSMSERILQLLGNNKHLKRVGENSREVVLDIFNDKLIDENLKLILS